MEACLHAMIGASQEGNAHRVPGGTQGLQLMQRLKHKQLAT